MEFLKNGAADAAITIILAHGAGAPMDSPFMEFFAIALAKNGHQVIRFEFPYMQRRRTEGGRRPPDRQPKLLDCWRSVIDACKGQGKLVIGGKSMGGRMASLIADEAEVDGLICLGYPFHALGKKDKPRTEHLINLKTPTLILQGERDTMGDFDTVSEYELSASIRFHWLDDGDHSFKPRKKSGRTEAENLSDAAASLESFVRTL